MSDQLYAVVKRPPAGWNALRDGCPRDARRLTGPLGAGCAVPVASAMAADARFGKYLVAVVTGEDKARQKLAALASADNPVPAGR